MKKKVFYLRPQVEGRQEFVCWGLAKEGANLDEAIIRNAALEALELVSLTEKKYITERSFSVLFAEDDAYFWVAVPRTLSVSIMTMFNQKLNVLTNNIKRLITSYDNGFQGDCPFYPTLSYDRGFIYDGKALEAIVLSEEQLAVNF